MILSHYDFSENTLSPIVAQIIDNNTLNTSGSVEKQQCTDYCVLPSNIDITYPLQRQSCYLLSSTCAHIRDRSAKFLYYGANKKFSQQLSDIQTCLDMFSNDVVDKVINAIR